MNHPKSGSVFSTQLENSGSQTELVGTGDNETIQFGISGQQIEIIGTGDNATLM